MSAIASLRPHQKAALGKAAVNLKCGAGTYIAHPPGLGKTLDGIAFSELVQHIRGLPTKVLVLCPKVAKAIWAQELEKWIGPSNLDGAVPWAAVTAHFREGLGFFITNYDQLSKEHEKLLMKWAPDVLILDEMHYVKSPSSQRTRAVKRLAKRIPYRMGLSGTPSNSPLDWHAQMQILAPQDPYWQKTFTQFKLSMIIPTGPLQPWPDRKRGANGFWPEELDRAIAATKPYVHVVSKDVLNLPEPVTTVVPITLSPSEMKAYEQMEHDLFVEFKDTDTVADAPSVLTKILRLQQITGGFVADTEHGIHRFGTSKLDACMELVEERVGAGQKVVIVARYREDCAALQKAMKVKYGSINGDTSDKDRADIMASFQTGSLMVVILQPRAGGVAISLSAASAMIIYSAEVSSIVMEQVIGRCWRPGQTGHLQILPLLVPHSVDSDLWGALRNKMEYTSLVKLLLAHLKG